MRSFIHRPLLLISAAAIGCGSGSASSGADAPISGTTDGRVDGGNTLPDGSTNTTGSFDGYYPSGFRLPMLAADPIPSQAKPATTASGFGTPSYIDATYGTRIYKATQASDYNGLMVRHEYSRRQAFNADNSRYLAITGNGHWVLYDGPTFTRLQKNGNGGALSGLAGDCEAIWHPTDPTKLFYTQNNGGLIWWEKNVETDTDTVMADFTGRLPWPGATSVWTKAEGTSSADGRYFAFMATAYDSGAQTNTIHGLFTYDRSTDQIVGTLDASAFDNAFPDHISISPSGAYVVPAWAYNPALGTRAYPVDFSSYTQLLPETEHTDLAIGPNGEDMFVYTDYQAGAIRAKNIATGDFFDLAPIYPRTGASYAAHISGKAFGRPGWVVVSTYADAADYGATAPDPILDAMHRKVSLFELVPNGRKFSVAHTHAAANYGGYFGEHQATISRDGTRILFASNFDDGGPPDSYMIGLPTSVYE